MTSRFRRPVVGGNWKMNTVVDEAADLAAKLVEAIDSSASCEVVVCPPFTNLTVVAAILAGSEISLGAQDLYWEPGGAFTGEISAAMIQSTGASWVICGHSERRRIMGETNQIVNRKVKRALETGLMVIFAVGETEAERSEGRTEAVLTEQLSGSLAGVSSLDFVKIVLAYEPVWAIGTGLTATPEQAQESHSFIRGWINRTHAPGVALSTRIQYGGSVTCANAADLMAMPDIDGALVGGASLKAAEFAQIVSAAGARRDPVG